MSDEHEYIPISPPPPLRGEARQAVVSPVTRYDFDMLSAEEVEWGNRLLGLMGLSVTREPILEALADTLSLALGMPHDVFFHGVRLVPGTLAWDPANPQFSTTFLLPPGIELGLISADLNLIQSWLEALLRDEPPEARTLLPMTARDFGLVTFILMHALNWLGQRGLPPFSLATHAGDVSLAAASLQRHLEIAEIVYIATNPIGAGVVRILMPVAMVQRLETFVSRAMRLDRRRRQLAHSRLHTVEVSLSVEAARAQLTHEELQSVEVGDVILLQSYAIEGLEPVEVEERAVDEEKSTETPALKNPVNPQFNGASGRIFLAGLAGDYLACVIRASASNAPWEVEVLDGLPRICRQFSAEKSLTKNPKVEHLYNDQSGEKSMDLSKTDQKTAKSAKNSKKEGAAQQKNAQNDTAEDQQKEADAHAALLNSPEVDVQICLGAVRISVGELARLQSGYVLELNRRVEDGVELVADGAVVGRGELVWVEERLGVRVRAMSF